MAEEGAGVNGFAGGGGPRGIHQLRAADAGGERKAAGEGFAQANQVGHHAAVFAGEPAAGAAKAGVNLVEDEQGAMFVAQPAEQRQEGRRWKVDAAAGLHGLDKEGADFFAAEKAADGLLDFRELPGPGGEWDEAAEFAELRAERVAEMFAVEYAMLFQRLPDGQLYPLAVNAATSAQAPGTGSTR